MSYEVRLLAYVVYAQAHEDPIQSKDLAAWVGTQPSQVRRDFQAIGCRGKVGTGYKRADIERAVLKHVDPRALKNEVVKQKEVYYALKAWLNENYPSQ